MKRATFRIVQAMADWRSGFLVRAHPHSNRAALQRSENLARNGVNVVDRVGEVDRVGRVDAADRVGRVDRVDKVDAVNREQNRMHVETK